MFGLGILSAFSDEQHHAGNVPSSASNPLEDEEARRTGSPFVDLRPHFPVLTLPSRRDTRNASRSFRQIPAVLQFVKQDTVTDKAGMTGRQQHTTIEVPLSGRMVMIKICEPLTVLIFIYLYILI